MNKREWDLHCNYFVDTMTSAKKCILDELTRREAILKDTMSYHEDNTWTEEDFKNEVEYINKMYGALEVADCMIELWSDRIGAF